MKFSCDFDMGSRAFMHEDEIRVVLDRTGRYVVDFGNPLQVTDGKVFDSEGVAIGKWAISDA